MNCLKEGNQTFHISNPLDVLVHNNGKDNLGKFDAHSDEAIFIGYASNSKTYRVYNKRTKIVEESIHVIFDESNYGTLSESFADLNLNQWEDHNSDEDEDPKN